ncbi:MAG TPA: DUF4476 domain-containing protein [Archangium sp.]|jgi:hypothetical protein|uniref:DUF4476 domain-containing protein n=1 Tax=Archangium sp. TaxID=1872627 RepID=UPI002EDAB334
MKALFVAITLLTAVTASAQNSQPMPTPPGQGFGTMPPTSTTSEMRADDNEFRRGRRGTMVVIEREEVEQRLARLEQLLGEANERAGRGNGKGKLREAYEELNDLRDLIVDAPDVRSYNPRPMPHQPAPMPPPAPVYQPIADAMLRSAMKAMDREPFADDKMNVLEDVADNNYFLVSQVIQVLPQFKFSKDRIEAVRVLWSRVLDKQNGYQLYNAFQFSTDKAEVKRIISAG